jgi:hypothetical protein
MSRDFTIQKYTQFCETLKRPSCQVMTVRQFLEMGQPQDFIVVLRHDVDRSLHSAIRMAHLAADYGIRATYYVRMTRQVFRSSEIKKLSQLGHEVGYHYEVLSKCRGSTTGSIALFEKELQQLRQVVPVDTISMHGSPLSPWNNLDLWKTWEYKNYDLLGEIYLTIDYSNIYYFTDTGRGWNSERYNLRDHVNSLKPSRKVHTTDQLIRFLTEKKGLPILINTHPNRWSGSWPAWFMSALTDGFINQLKWMISLLYARRQ